MVTVTVAYPVNFTTGLTTQPDRRTVTFFKFVDVVSCARGPFVSSFFNNNLDISLSINRGVSFCHLYGVTFAVSSYAFARHFMVCC